MYCRKGKRSRLCYWSVGDENSSSSPNQKGFDRFYGYLDQKNAHSYYPQYLVSDNQKEILNKKKYSHDLIIDEAFKFIKKNKDKPFFAYLPITLPHAKYHMPKKYYQQFEGKFGKGKVAKTCEVYAGMMTLVDKNIGDLFKLLKDLNIDDKTVVFLTTDNGASKSPCLKFFNSTGAYKGLKRQLHEGGIKVPLIAHYPAKIKANTTSNLRSGFQDLMPTFCSLAGVTPPKNINGISMLPEMFGNPADQKIHKYLYWEFEGDRAIIFDSGWKLLDLRINKRRKRDKNSIELYNLNTDPTEQKNLAKYFPEKLIKGFNLMDKAHVYNSRYKLNDE
ncbi:sulfatase-like hydrolase/transferase [Lentisphaerota bacterium WC36G]